MVPAFTYTRVSGTAAGTSVISAAPICLGGIFIGQNKTGTVSMYDSATAAGTAAGNYMGDVENTCGTTPIGPLIGAWTHNGLTVFTSGTTDMLFIWG